jgi:hypothetical protein
VRDMVTGALVGHAASSLFSGSSNNNSRGYAQPPVVNRTVINKTYVAAPASRPYVMPPRVVGSGSSGPAYSAPVRPTYSRPSPSRSSSRR